MGNNAVKMDKDAQRVIDNSIELAFEFKCYSVNTEHLLLALLSGILSDPNTQLAERINIEKVCKKIRSSLSKISVEKEVKKEEIVFTPLVIKIINHSETYAVENKFKAINARIIFNSLLVNSGEMVSKYMGDVLGNTTKKEKKAIIATLTSKDYKPEDISRLKHINYFGVNVTQQALAKKLDPVIGRENELNQLIQVLGRRYKNNPVLVGEPGVGKSCIIEGLAQRIVENKVPDFLQNKHIIQLNLTFLIAGSKLRGDFEGRIQNIVTEIKNNENIILFIDELHTIMGAGGGEGALDISNIFKPYLARGEIRCIGATTLTEYKKIEKDSALDRRFQSLVVNPNTQSETFEILKGLRLNYENYHAVKYSDEILQYIVNLSDQYITNKHFPDKAITLLDEIASYKKISLLNNKKKNNIITKQDVEQAIANVLRIPADKIGCKYLTKLKNLEIELNQSVIGQTDAINRIINVFKRKQLKGVKTNNSVYSSIILAGPSRCGKTFLIKQMEKELYTQNNQTLYLNMSDYSEHNSMSKLLGSAPGYIDHESGGTLTEFVRKYPNSIIVCENIDKCHQEILNLFYQILTEGKVLDNRGNYIDFHNVTIFFTITHEVYDNTKTIGFINQNEKKPIEFKKFIDNKLLKLVDETIGMVDLNDQDKQLILSKELDFICKNINNEYNIKLEFSDDIKTNIYNSLMVDNVVCIDDIFHFVKKNVIENLADTILEDTEDLSDIEVQFIDKQLTFSRTNNLVTINT